MLPESLVPLLAVGLPVLEALAALAILTPPLQKGGSLILVGMLAVFIVALSSALTRGLDVDCGCFGEGSSAVSPLLIVRNVALAAIAVWSFLRAP
jgi:putative oxidoreductase